MAEKAGSSDVKKKYVKDEEWNEVFLEFDKKYKDAYFKIDEAIKLDEEGKTDEALQLYQSGLNLLDAALEVPVQEPNKPDFLWEKVLSMSQKLRKSRKEILIRIENINERPQPTVNELPPSYEDVIASSKSSQANGTSNNGNNFQYPGPSTKDAPYIPPSAVHDQKLLANLYDTAEGNSNAPITYSDLSQQLNQMKLDKNEEILFSCNNVQLFFISPDGRVSSTSEPNKMIIARVHDDNCSILDEVLINILSDMSRETNDKKKKKLKNILHRRKYHHHHHHRHHHHHHNKTKKNFSDLEDPVGNAINKTFLQVGSLVYPLIPEISPCIRTDYGAFILPDINSNEKGAAIGLILQEEDQEKAHELLNLILNESDSYGRSRRSIDTDSASPDYSSKIVRGAAYIAQNIVKGAGSTARFLDSRMPKIVDRINPQSEPKEIHQNLKKTVELAKNVSEKAVNVTDYLVSKVATATSSLGRYLSPYIQQSGSKLLTSTTSMTEKEAQLKINSLLGITSNAVEGISTVYGGLETAAAILAQSLGNNTIQIIEYKYGQPAGALTSDAFATVGNVYHAQRNFKFLRPKGIAKAAIRGAGSAMIENYKNNPHDAFRGAGPGDGSGFHS